MPSGLAALAESSVLRVSALLHASRRSGSISVNGTDITAFLRDAAVEQNVSPVSAVPTVRAALVRLQREAATADVVMAGRDIGTVVLPDAELKVYLDASVDVHAERRQSELTQKGRVESLEQVRVDLARRDRLDSERAASPLRPALDAIHIKSDAVSLDQVIASIVRLARERGALLVVALTPPQAEPEI